MNVRSIFDTADCRSQRARVAVDSPAATFRRDRVSTVGNFASARFNKKKNHGGSKPLHSPSSRSTSTKLAERAGSRIQRVLRLARRFSFPKWILCPLSGTQGPGGGFDDFQASQTTSNYAGHTADPNTSFNSFIYGASSGFIRSGLGAYGERVFGSGREFVQSNVDECFASIRSSFLV